MIRTARSLNGEEVRMKTENLIIRSDPDLKRRLRELAEEKNQTVSELVTDLIKKELWTAGR